MKAQNQTDKLFFLGIHHCYNNKVLYHGTVDGNLTKKGWSMKKDISLGEFKPGAGKNLIVKLSLSEEMDNEYQELLGKVKWVFSASQASSDSSSGQNGNGDRGHNDDENNGDDGNKGGSGNKGGNGKYGENGNKSSVRALLKNIKGSKQRKS